MNKSPSREFSSQQCKPARQVHKLSEGPLASMNLIHLDPHNTSPKFRNNQTKLISSVTVRELEGSKVMCMTPQSG
jgi:hypothetical protein